MPARAPDKDHVDVFVNPGTPQDFAGPVFVIDQNNEQGKFDEPKVMVGFATEQEARAAYLKNYTKGWESRIAGITAMPMDELKTKLQDEKAFMQPQFTVEPTPAQPAPAPQAVEPVQPAPTPQIPDGLPDTGAQAAQPDAPNRESLLDVAVAEYRKAHPKNPEPKRDIFEGQVDAIISKNADTLRKYNIGGAVMMPSLRATFEKATGLKLPKTRSGTERMVDEWAGVTPEQRAQKDADRTAAVKKRSAESSEKLAISRAESLQVKDGETTISGKSWVDRIIGEGFTQFSSRKKGVATEYYLSNGERAYKLPSRELYEYARIATRDAAQAELTRRDEESGVGQDEAGEMSAASVPKKETKSASTDAMKLPPADNYTAESYEYVKEWGEFSFNTEAQARRYAAALEKGEGGKWVAARDGANGWRAHRVGRSENIENELTNIRQDRATKSEKLHSDTVAVLENELARIEADRPGMSEHDKRVADRKISEIRENLDALRLAQQPNPEAHLIPRVAESQAPAEVAPSTTPSQEGVSTLPAAVTELTPEPPAEAALTASQIPADMTITLDVQVDETQSTEEVEVNARKMFKDASRKVKRLRALRECLTK